MLQFSFFPKVFAEIRAQSYRKYAWPAFVRVSAWWAAAAGILIALALAGGRTASNADFYGVIPHVSMVGAFAIFGTIMVE